MSRFRSARRPLAIALPLAVVAGIAVAGQAMGEPEAEGGARVTGSATLPDLPLAEFSNGLLAGTVADDRGVDLGGIGSDIFPTGTAGEFWTVTDRGPNGQIKVDGAKRRTFPVPGFDPAIVRIRVAGDRIEVVDSIPLTTRSGKAVTGLPNQASRDEAPYDYSASTPLEFDPNGLDTEGIVRAADGTFWLADEYGPSLVHVAADGEILTRYVPKGLALTGADYPVVEVLPEILLKRKVNRGFEGLAQLPGGDLVLAVQSPLSNPDKSTGDPSRNTRLIRFNPRSGAVTAEYVYRFEPVGVVEPGQTDTAELKLSSLVAIGSKQLLVQERTDKGARLYKVKLDASANVLGSAWDSAATSPSLEKLDNPAGAGVPVLAKKLVVDLNTLPAVPGKIEGVAVTGPSTIVVINDNDFGMTDGTGAFDAAGRLVDSGIETKVVTIELGESL
ncbi:esterase-like activity of phytase family protein [Streptomyces polyrhachis]|uniref:Esterase-like activity of phytase family protein n=1 Tax=Streptomyces polyrhachis TaxID=1282885 RepID=A0ABW2GNJ9_9ACTN